MIIDVHVHYQKKEGFIEELIKSCSENGVEKVCLNGCGDIWNQYDNDAVLKVSEKLPDFVIPFAFVDMKTATAADIEAYHKAGFKGLKSQNPPEPYDSKTFWGLYEQAENHRLPWLFHTGVTARYPGEKDPSLPCPRQPDVSGNRMRPIHLDAIARDFRQLTIIGAHLGIPWFSEAAFMLLSNPNIYFDLSGLDLTGQVYPTLLPFAELFWAGQEHWTHLVFGTEGGPENYKQRVKEHYSLFQKHHLSQESQQRIMAGNIARALHL